MLFGLTGKQADRPTAEPAIGVAAMKGIEGITTAGATFGPAGSGKQQKQQGFVDTLVEAMRQVDQQIKEADRAAEAFASGASGNIHEVMIAAEKAELSLSLASGIRNKLLEAYREIMRMQV